MLVKNGISGASFRDPSGFVFFEGNLPYRQINHPYKEHYDHLMSSGLYRKLVDAGLLIPHDEVNLSLARTSEAYKVIQPQPVPFISYPYEWCFSQIKDAALATITIQKLALQHGMVLKDSSAYNIQFVDGKPVMIDTLSFEKYAEGQPWVGYRQFCQFFIAPLALMSTKDPRLAQMLRVHVDGIPIDLASSLLPKSSYFRIPLLSHIHLHAKSQKKYAGQAASITGAKLSKFKFRAIMENLESSVRRIHWQPSGTEWADYYGKTNYSEQAWNHKTELVRTFVAAVNPEMVWDLGANTGFFSRLAAAAQAAVISFDNDPGAVEQNYLRVKKEKETHILPLLVDLTNPSPSLGYENRERMSLIERGPADVVMALALIHHIAISNNVPLPRIAAFFAKLAKTLIIEFIPKSDSQVQRLLATRRDIFGDYSRGPFERAFGEYFKIEQAIQIKESERILYLMDRHTTPTAA